jgi:hypothetical protein
MRALLAVLSVLILTTAAQAECAWVLWSDAYWGSIQKSPLRPIGAFSKLNECEIGQNSKIKEIAADPPLPASDLVYDKVESLANMVSVMRYRKATGELVLNAVYRYLCLPDTIDPRGPKGK